MSIKNSQHIQNMCQGTHFIPDMSPGSQSVFWTRWLLFLMGYHVPPDWNSLVPLALVSSPHNENWNMSRTQEGHWRLWIFQSDKVLINSREKGDLIIWYALSLYWLRDKVVRNKISEQLYVLLKEKLSWIKLPSLSSLAQLIFFHYILCLSCKFKCVIQLIIINWKSLRLDDKNLLFSLISLWSVIKHTSLKVCINYL